MMITQLVVYQILLILKKNYRLIAVDLNKQKALDADPKPIQQIIFTEMHQIIQLRFIASLNNQKKQYQNFPKEQQKIFN